MPTTAKKKTVDKNALWVLLRAARLQREAALARAAQAMQSGDRDLGNEAAKTIVGCNKIIRDMQGVLKALEGGSL